MKLEEIRKLVEAVPKGVEFGLRHEVPEHDIWEPFTHGKLLTEDEGDALLKFIRVARTLMPKLLKVAEAAGDYASNCPCVGLTYHGGHSNRCIAVREALAELESDASEES